MLRDGLVWGMKHERIQQRLLSKDDTLTLEKAIDIAQTIEPVIKQSSLIRSTQGVEDHLENIHKVQNKEILNFYREERKRLSRNFSFKDKGCFFCQKKLCKTKKKHSFVQRKQT